jgi:hypothetical protein
MFFAAKGRNGEDIFDENLTKRTGEYPQYHHGLDLKGFLVILSQETLFACIFLRKS